MRTIRCRMKLPDNVPPGANFQTPDLEDRPEGGYEISPDGRLSFVSPYSRGENLPDTSQCGPVRFSGCPAVLHQPARGGTQVRCGDQGRAGDLWADDRR